MNPARCPPNHHHRRLLEPWSHLLTALAVLLLMVAARGGAWVEDARPKVYVQFGEESPQRFLGNQTYKDHFKLLQKDHNWLLVGARNFVYNISLHDLKEFTDYRIEWPANGPHKDLCIIKGRTEDDCQNYIRILAKIDDERLLVCGTNAYKPYCRHYRYLDNNFAVEKEYEGKGLCPSDPNHNSTGVYVDGQLYTATVSDFSGTDPMIYRKPLITERSDLKHLNAPNFVNSFSYKDYVFFFFRETAVEYINCGKAVFSRVARVCKHDKGGPHQFGDRWTSFLKSRLNCSVPGEYPFYFDEIQSTSDIIDGQYGGAANKLVYGVFTTPVNAISGSAVCAFSMYDVMRAFEGQFKEQETMNSNWLPVPSLKVPEPRPGECVNDSRTLPDVTVNFVKNHPLMDKPVPSFFGRPIVTRISLQYRFTQIAVDSQVETVDGEKYDVIFIGTDNGKVIKTLNAASYKFSDQATPVVIEEIEVLPKNIPIKNLQVVRRDGPLDNSKLIVVSDDEVQAIKLHRCSSNKITSCGECIALQDPYCAWSVQQKRCVAGGSAEAWSAAGGRFLQNITSGEHSGCRSEAVSPVAVQTERNSPNEPVSSTATTPPCVCPQIIEGGFKSSPSPPVVLVKADTRGFYQTLVDGDSSDRSSNSINPMHKFNTLDNEIGQGLEEINIIPSTLAEINQPGPKMPSSQERPHIYTADTLAVAVVVAIVVALAMGFTAGFAISRRCCGSDSEYVSTYRGPPFQEHLNSFPGHDGALNDSTYLPPCPNTKPINLVLNVPPKNANGKNANSSAENKPVQKVKKTYI